MTELQAPETTTVQTPSTEVLPPPETPEPPQSSGERRSVPAQPIQSVATAGTSDDPSEWREFASGKEVRVLNPDDKYADCYRSAEPLSLGRAICAIVSGDWANAPAEQRALSTSSNPSAGIIVPNPLAATVIDLARAKSVLSRSGAKTIPMESSTLTIARVATDATVEVHGESSTLTGSDIVFDAIELSSYTLAVFLKMSRELAADASNAASLIEQTIAAKLAERIDFYGLQGTGSGQPLGLLNFSGMNSVAVGGGVDYDNVLDGIKACRNNNAEPNAMLLSPTNVDALEKLKVNAEVNHYATAPTSVQRLQALDTTNMPNDKIAVGDFSQFLIGLRQNPVIETTTEGGTSFAAHEAWVKITWRGSFATEHRTSFTLLTGIS